MNNIKLEKRTCKVNVYNEKNNIQCRNEYFKHRHTKLTKSKLKESESAISECETIPQDRVCLLAVGARKNEQELER